jgi:hypothetical protein
VTIELVFGASWPSVCCHRWGSQLTQDRRLSGYDALLWVDYHHLGQSKHLCCKETTHLQNVDQKYYCLLSLY